MADKPIIGSYRKPKEQTPAESLLEGVQGEIQDSAEVAEPITQKAQSYKEILKEKGIEQSKAHAVVDAMLEKGFYEETLSITKNVSVTFRTRTHGDYVRYLRALEIYNPKFVEKQNELQVRYYLAASLVSFKGKAFPHVTMPADTEALEDAFNERLNWVEKQPERIINLLANKLSRFDDLVLTVMSEGVVENF